MFIPILILVGALISLALQGLGYGILAIWIIRSLLVMGIIGWSWSMLKDIKKGKIGVDVIAIAAMLTSLILNQLLPGVVILLMLSIGEGLEDYAMRRARKQLTALLNNAPSIAHKKVGSQIKDVRADILKAGDRVIVKPGEVVSVDGLVLTGRSTVDQARLTGESLPVDIGPHDRVLAGSINQQGLLEVKALVDASESQYQHMIQLVRQAEENKGDFVRLADRYTVVFTLLTVMLCLIAWLLSHDWIRVLAVLVAATPCPLILATPIAIISGVSRCAGKGVIVKGGGPLEVMARVNAMVFDKTGTLTFGTPTIHHMQAVSDSVPILQLAASLDQGSTHVLGKALKQEALHRKVELFFPDHFHEDIGLGVTGTIKSQVYHFGRKNFLEGKGVMISKMVTARQEHLKMQGIRTVYLAKGKTYLGAIEFTDELKPGTKQLISRLRAIGLKKLSLLTGDKKSIARKIATRIGIQEVKAECVPEDKANEIMRIRRDGSTVAMIGDGVNDAPALALADVGIAMGVIGSSAATEAADIVITDDNVSKVIYTIQIARYALKVAQQGILFGISMSLILMIAAALGYLPPVEGSILQEGIDIVVITNALRVHTAKFTVQ